MLDKLASILRDECKLEKTRPILAGVSGGPDSLCLLAMLLLCRMQRLLRPRTRWSPSKPAMFLAGHRRSATPSGR